MESLQEKFLTLDEKAKLKERLALLKKEYKRTVNRLQRSQRAERVKSHVKKTIQEQNRLLNQESAIADSALVSTGLVNCTHNASGDVGESQRSADTPTADKERKTCVTFNLEPEILHAGSRTPPCSGGENSSGQEADAASKAEGTGPHNPNQTMRSRLRLSRSAKRACFSESPSPNVNRFSNIFSVLEGPQNNMVAKMPPGSPVFKKCLEEEVSITLNDNTMSLRSEDTKPVDIFPEIGDGPSVGPSLLTTADHSPGDLKHSDNTRQTNNTTAAHSSIDNTYKTLETREEKPLYTTQCPGVRYRTSDATCELSVVPQVVNSETTSQRNPLLCSGNQSLPIQEVHGERPLTEEDHNPLSSCTLVEGLLFPVEYYVRTTRRMSSCQRKVDLDAVINSQLGMAKKGTRGRPRRSSTSLSPSLNVGGTLSIALSCPSVINSTGEVTRSRRGRGRKSCTPVVSSSGLSDIPVQLEFGCNNSLISSSFQSEKENWEEKAANKMNSCNEENSLTNITEHSQIKEVLRTGESSVSLQSDRKVYSLRPRDAASLCLHTLPSDTQDFESNMYTLRTSKETNEPSGSPFPPLSRRISLDHLLRSLDITDFHLPDEEFGILKLEKLKSMSPLEPFVPKPTKESRKPNRACRNRSATLPPTDNSAVLQGALGPCPPTSEHDVRLSIFHGDCLNDEQSVESKENTLENNAALSIEEPKHGLVASQVCLTSDPINTLEPSPVICVPMEPRVDASSSPSSCKKQLFPLNLSLEGHNLDPTSRSAEEKLFSNDAVSTSAAQAPVGSLDHDELNVSALSMDVLEKHTQPEILREDPLVSSTNMESNVVAHSPTETLPTVSSSKELTYRVFFTTSVCSFPLDATNECGAPAGTPGYPFLGSTPAVFSSPQSSNTTITCSPEYVEQKDVTMEGLLPEVSGHEHRSVSCEERTVAQGERDVKLCSVLSQSGDLSQACDHTTVPCNYVEHCGKKNLPAETHEVIKHQGAHETGNRLDHDNVEEGTLGSGHLRLISEIQDTCGGGCAVDLCSVWWEFSGSTDLCIVSASESSVCLWRPQAAGKWECAHTWNFIEMPVIQILPLSQEKNIVCVALGNLDIMELWVLFSHPETPSWEKQLVKCGQTKTAQGLSRHRVVSSSGVGDGQVVELWQLSERGSTEGTHTLMAPRDSVLAFSEVDGERDALVGSTVDNNLVIWNSVTGHLLSRIYIGDLCSDLTCLSATADSGLLFLVVGSLFSKHCEPSGSCIFKLIAANAQGGASALVMSYTIPEGFNSRYLEGDVKKQRVAAVLTCGSIAFWDLPRSHCSAMLPPSSDTPWCLVRWGHKPSCLLTGRKDGTIFVYEYTDQSSYPAREDPVTLEAPCHGGDSLGSPEEAVT